MPKGHLTFTGDVLETIRVRLVRYESRPGSPTRSEIADRIDRDVGTIHKFIQGESKSSSVAADIISAYPELGHDITCPYCKQHMPGTIADPKHSMVT